MVPHFSQNKTHLLSVACKAPRDVASAHPSGLSPPPSLTLLQPYEPPPCSSSSRALSCPRGPTSQSSFLSGMLILYVYKILSYHPSNLSLNVTTSGGLPQPLRINTTTQLSSKYSPIFEIVIFVCSCRHTLCFTVPPPPPPPPKCTPLCLARCRWGCVFLGTKGHTGPNDKVGEASTPPRSPHSPQPHPRIYNQELLSVLARVGAAVMGNTQVAVGGQEEAPVSSSLKEG